MPKFRIEKDSMGDVKVPENAFYAAQTQRAVDNFPISGIKMPRAIIRALGLIKKTAAQVNLDLGLLDEKKSNAIQQAANDVAEGKYDEVNIVSLIYIRLPNTLDENVASITCLGAPVAIKT